MNKKIVRKALSAPFPLTKPTWPSSVPRPPKKRRVGLDYDTAWARRYPARLARAALTDFVSSPITNLIAPATITGDTALERLDGPVIFAANHNSHFDTAVLLAAIPAKFRHKMIVAAASDYFFDSTVKATVVSLVLGAIPIERSKVSRRSAQTALDLLDEGWSVLIYPEGGRSPDGWLHEFKGGAAYLSVRTGAPVIPLWLEGTGRILPKSPTEKGQAPGGSGSESARTATLRRHPVSVTFGRPLRPQEGEDARRMGPRIEEAVALLGREVGSDYYSARRHDDRPLTYGPDAAPWRRQWARPRPIEISERLPRDSWPR
jgi:1-acyl-sn-glycerol-3-phosphate acyltransferase